MNVSFGFIDEVGLSAGDPQQPFMALGLLKLHNTSGINTELYKLLYGFTSYNIQQRRSLIRLLSDSSASLNISQLNNIFLPSRHHEFKYDSLGFPNISKYKEIIDLLMKYDFEFHCIVIDKQSEDFDREKYGTYWHAYCKFLSLLIKNTCENDKLLAVVDYLHKPESGQKIEDFLADLTCVTGVLQADSRSFPLLQITDILLGSIVFEKKKERGIYIRRSNKVKVREEFNQYLCTQLGIESLSKNQLAKCKVKKINLWEFKPKKIRDDTHTARPDG